MKGIARIAVAAAFAALLGSFAGALHPLGDSLAVFRLAIAATGLLLLPLARPARVPALALGAGFLAGIVTVGWHKLPRAAPGPLTVYQKNMHFRDARIDEIARDILATGPDIVTLQEVSLGNEALLDRLWEAYPAQHLCRYTPNSGLAVLSRLPAVGQPVCGESVALAAMRVMTAQGAVWAVSLHLAHPWPGTQRAQIDVLRHELPGVPGQRVIGGDFNMIPWSHALRVAALASGSRRAQPARTSFRLGPVPLAIDHVLAPGGGRVQARPWLGGDHRGLFARVHPMPE
ncbi:endonuclease/exonuclease/phosphatase family protein [Roseovarius salis]|uniref:endonuclease/exonuclease/phosphatase family protein n=1 Tax=Roseovarius salis TaxID=3376063 RepID=UPI0037C7EEA0